MCALVCVCLGCIKWRVRVGAGWRWLLQVVMSEEGLCSQLYSRQREGGGGGGGGRGGGSGPLGQVISGPHSSGGHSCRRLVWHARTRGRLRRENRHATPWGGEWRGAECVCVTYDLRHNRLDIWGAFVSECNALLLNIKLARCEIQTHLPLRRNLNMYNVFI